MSSARRAVVLLSGGLDSATTLAIARSLDFDCFCMSFAYGQKQVCELEAAKRVAAALGAREHRVASIDLGSLGGSALTTSTPVPKDRTESQMQHGIPVTYVPARNTVFLAFALAWAEVLEAYDMFIGVNAIDYSGYPDCRPEFIAAFERLANVATSAAVLERGRFVIHAPLMHLTKGEIIQRGLALGVDYALTHSCYDPVDERACGRCDACQLRRAGFIAAGMVDPTLYAEGGLNL